jgi:hypothetical protein
MLADATPLVNDKKLLNSFTEVNKLDASPHGSNRAKRKSPTQFFRNNNYQ